MKNKNNLENRLAKKIKSVKKLLVFVTAILVTLILLVFLLIPVYVSSDKGRQAILAKVNSVVGGQLNFASLSMGWFKGVELTELSYNDKIGRTLFEVKQIATKPHYASILMGNLSFGKTVLEQPKVEINLKDLDEKPEQEEVYPVETDTVVIALKRIDLVVKDGNIKVTDQKSQTVQLSDINSRINLRPEGKRTDFDINATVIGKDRESNIHASGGITTKFKEETWSWAGTSGDLNIEVNDLELESLESLFTLAGVDLQARGKTTANINGTIKDGHLVKLEADVIGKNLQITSQRLKGDSFRTETLSADVKLEHRGQLVNISKLKIGSDWLTAEATGDIPTTYKSLAQFIKADSKQNLKAYFKCDVAQLASQMPRTLGFKRDMRLTAGRLTANIQKVTEAGQSKIYADAKLNGLRGSVAARTVSLSQPISAEAQITSEADRINFEKLDVTGSFAKVTCTGTSKVLTYDSQFNLGKLQSELGQFIDLGQYSMAGELLSKGLVKSDKNKIGVVGSSVIKNLYLTSQARPPAAEPSADITFSVDVDTKKSVINVGSMQANASFGQLSTENAVIPLGKESSADVSLPIHARKVDLAKVQPFVALFSAIGKDMILAGIADSDISISSQKERYRIFTDSTEIKDFKFAYAGKKPFEQKQVSLILDAQLGPTGLTATYQVTSPQIKVKGNFEKAVSQETTMVKGSADFDYDWAAVSTFASQFMPQDLKLEGKRKDTINFVSWYPADKPDKMLANLNTKTRIGFDKADYMGLVFEPTELDIQVQNGIMKIAPFSTTVNKGTLSFAGQADFNAKPPLLKTPAQIHIAKNIQINDATTSRLLKYLNPIFANAVNVSGVANFNCQSLAIPLAGSSKRYLEIIGTISLSDVRLRASDFLGKLISLVGTSAKDQKITIHPTEFSIKDGFVRYQNMQMDVGDNPFNFKGTIGLEDKSLEMAVILPYTTEGKTARIGKEIPGQRISLPIKGTVDRPELDVGKLLEDQLKQKAMEELYKILK